MQDKLKQAKALIDAKAYRAAAEILRDLNNPTAKTWLETMEKRGLLMTDEDAAQMKLAKALMDTGRYSEAKTILFRLARSGNVAARAWLGRVRDLEGDEQAVPKKKPLVRREVWFLFFLLVIPACCIIESQFYLLNLPYNVYTAFGDCPAQPWVDDVEGTLVNYRDVADIAARAPRREVPTYLVGLQSLRRQFEALAYPGCMEATRDEFIAGMRDIEFGLETFVEYTTSSSVAADYISDGQAHFRNAWEMAADEGGILDFELRQPF